MHLRRTPRGHRPGPGDSQFRRAAPRLRHLCRRLRHRPAACRRGRRRSRFCAVQADRRTDTIRSQGHRRRPDPHRRLPGLVLVSSCRRRCPFRRAHRRRRCLGDDIELAPKQHRRHRRPVYHRGAHRATKRIPSSTPSELRTEDRGGLLRPSVDALSRGPAERADRAALSGSYKSRSYDVVDRNDELGHQTPSHPTPIIGHGVGVVRGLCRRRARPRSGRVDRRAESVPPNSHDVTSLETSSSDFSAGRLGGACRRARRPRRRRRCCSRRSRWTRRSRRRCPGQSAG